jgi:hypothetical protein
MRSRSNYIQIQVASISDTFVDHLGKRESELRNFLV